MIELYILFLLLIWLAGVMQALNVMVKKGIEPSFWSFLFVILPIVNTCIAIRYFRPDTSGFCGFRDFWKKLNDTDEDSNSDRIVEQKPAVKVVPFDQYEGFTDFERILADVCIGWIGEENGWKQYIKDNADVLLKIAVKMFNSVQDAPFEQNPAWSEDVESAIKLLNDMAEEQEEDYCPYNANHLRKAAHYLESCRHQNTWKPSKGQIKAVEDAIDFLGCTKKVREDLKSLREQLKKLREE